MSKIKKFFHKPFGEKINTIKVRLSLFKTQFFYKHLFNWIGIKSYIEKPIRITNPQNIILKDQISIWPNARIEAITKYNNKKYNPSIIIDNGVSIQQNIHMTCANKIYIGRNTAIAANVTITDIHHQYLDISIPIEKQDIICKYVVIMEDCKIYNNVVILPGVTIGKHCTIGANSIVNTDIPDYSVAVGNPARVIKRYNVNKNKWEKTNEKGQFLDK